MLELRHLKTLQTLRDCGTLAAAAERLCVTQSALSHQIKELESKLGVSLFNRKTKPLGFTPAGQRLLALANRVMPEIQAAELELKRLEQGTAGRLYMAIECHSCFDWLMPAVNHYREQWPAVELDFSGGFHVEPLPALLRGDLDLVVTSDPQPLPGIHYHALFRYESLLALANNHPLLKKRAVAPEDLREETLITYPVDKNRLDIYAQFLNLAGIEPKATRHAELTLMIVQLVASFRGVACLPNWVLKEYLDPQLISARPLGQGLWSTLYLAVRENQRQLPYIVSFFDIAGKVCFKHLFGIRAVTEK